MLLDIEESLLEGENPPWKSSEKDPSVHYYDINVLLVDALKGRMGAMCQIAWTMHLVWLLWGKWDMWSSSPQALLSFYIQNSKHCSYNSHNIRKQQEKQKSLRLLCQHATILIPKVLPFRIGPVVWIPGSHPGDRGSIPRFGIFFFSFPHQKFVCCENHKPCFWFD